MAAVLAVLALTSGFTQQLRDRKAPSTPKNLRVTGVGSWTVSLAWQASTDNSGQFHYVVQCSNGRTMNVPQTSTTCNFNDFSDHWPTFSFRVFAVDESNNWSRASNTVSANLLPDTTPPSTPTVGVEGSGPTHVELNWSATDDDPTLRYDVYRDGQRIIQQTAATSGFAYVLQPETAYTFTVQARDSAGHWSAMSAPLVVTTPAADPNDHEPPTTPPGLHDNGGPFQDGEVWFFWNDSTDNVTPSDLIRYDVYLNGVYDGSLINFRRHITYLTLGMVNTVEFYAVDEAGNVSAPAVLTYDLR